MERVEWPMVRTSSADSGCALPAASFRALRMSIMSTCPEVLSGQVGIGKMKKPALTLLRGGQLDGLQFLPTLVKLSHVLFGGGKCRKQLVGFGGVGPMKI